MARGTVNGAKHHDHDVERRLLSCLLIDPDQYSRVLRLGLRTDHFHFVAHREVYQAAGALWETFGFLDATTLKSFLDEQGVLEVVKADYLAEIMGATATVSAAPHYAEIVLRHAERREIIEAAKSVLEASRNSAANDDVLKDATTRFTGIQQAYATRVRPVSAAEYLTRDAPDVEPIIPGLLDRGDRHFIVSQSKAGKSWFALQQALCISTGLPFLGWDIPEPKRVAICQFELREAQYHKRVRRQAAALDLTPADLGGRLDIFNLRGAPFDIFDVASDYDVVYLDPLYVMLAQAGADENKSTDVAQVLTRIASWQRQSEAAVVTIHHGTKGHIGDRQVVDRGAGSGAIGRDMDGMLTLAPARDDPKNCLVVDHIARNYKAADPFVIQFVEGYFHVREGIDPVVETAKSAAAKNQKGPSVKEIAEQVAKTITSPTLTEPLKQRIRDDYSIGKNKAAEVLTWLESCGFARWKTREKHSRSMFGPEDQRPDVNTDHPGSVNRAV